MHLFRSTDVNIADAGAAAPTAGRSSAAGTPRPNPNFSHHRAEEQRRRLLVQRARLRAAPAAGAAASRCSPPTPGRSTEDTTQASTFFSDATNGTTVGVPGVHRRLQQGAGRLGHAAQLGHQRDRGTCRSRAARPASPARCSSGWQVTGDQHDAQRPAADGVRAEQPVALAVVAVDRARHRPRSARPGAGRTRRERRARPARSVVRSGGVRAAAGRARSATAAAARSADPNLRTVDLAAVKRVAAGRHGAARSSCASRCSTCFNRANFGNPTLIAFAGAGRRRGAARHLRPHPNTVTSARQMQLG